MPAGNGEYLVGITDHAQAQLGDVVYVQSPQAGDTIQQGAACGVIESVKTAADLHAPASGVVTAVNSVLEDAPERLNTEPYAAWIFRMRPEQPILALLDAAAYEQSLG
jgi:glycine cleavage system H protein